VEKNETRSKKQEVTVTITPESPRQGDHSFDGPLRGTEPQRSRGSY